MKLSTTGKLLLAIVSISFVGSCGALALGAYAVGKLFVLPALVLSGWAFVGHLVTLDDDAPGEWSNPEWSRKLWHSSLVQLLVKLSILGGALTLFFAQSK